MSAIKNRVQAVPVPDKKELLDFLNGFITESQCLDAEMVAAEPVETPGTAAAVAAMEDDSMGRPSKRPRTEDVVVAAASDFHVPPAFEYEDPEGGAAGASSSGGDASSKDPALWTIEDILANELPYSTHQSIMTAKKDLSAVLQLYNKAQRAADKQGSTPTAGRAMSAYAAATPRTPAGYPGMGLAATPTSAHAAGFGGPITPAPGLPGSSRRPPASGSRSGHKRGRETELILPGGPEAAVPIIIIPQATSSLVQMANVYELLHNGAFVEPAEKKRKDREDKRDPLKEVEIEHAAKLNPSKNAKYRVIDDVKLLKKEDWARVVAVFATGAQWQFTGWPFRGGPAEIFDKICAFHLHYDDEPLNANIKQWKVHRLAVSKTKRYQDRMVIMDFWRILTEFIAAHPEKKRFLFY